MVSCHIGVDTDSSPDHLVVSMAADVVERDMPAGLVHSEERVIDGDSGHIGIDMPDALNDCAAKRRIVMNFGQHEYYRTQRKGDSWIWWSVPKPIQEQR